MLGALACPDICFQHPALHSTAAVGAKSNSSTTTPTISCKQHLQGSVGLSMTAYMHLCFVCLMPKHLLLTTMQLLLLLLAGLTSLLLGHNQLSVLPACLGQISGLVQLGLEGNCLQAVEPGALEGLAQLQTLTLQDNQLSQLPESLGGHI
jgi:hypothetical protein